MFWLSKRRRLDTIQLSAVWIIASKDQRRIISYPSLYYRLTDNVSFKDKKCLSDIRGSKGYKQLCELVESRRELFRMGVPKKELDEWTEDLKKWKNEPSPSYPAWLAEIGNDKVEASIIDSLGSADGFRSQ